MLSAEDDDDEDGGAEVRIEEDVGRSRISPRLQVSSSSFLLTNWKVPTWKMCGKEITGSMIR